MKIHSLACAIGALFACAGAAGATDLGGSGYSDDGYKSAAPAWSGPYVAIGVGHNRMDARPSAGTRSTDDRSTEWREGAGRHFTEAANEDGSKCESEKCAFPAGSTVPDDLTPTAATAGHKEGANDYVNADAQYAFAPIGLGSDSGGLTGLAQIGYDAQMGRVVMGVFGDYQANFEESSLTHGGRSYGLGDSGALTLGARVGMPIGRVMPYVGAGYGWHFIDPSVPADTSEPNAYRHSSSVESDALSGPVAMLGVELALGGGWSAKLEGRRAWLGDGELARSTHFDGAGNTLSETTVRIDPVVDTIWLGLSYKIK